MEITQIQLSYLETEDRMMMRINLGDQKHVSLLLTRRICRFMLENLNAFLDLTVQTSVPGGSVIPLPDPEEQANTESLQPFAGLDINTPFEERKSEGNILPAGKSSELVMNAACNRGENALSFTLFIQAAESLNLNLPRKLALGLHQLMATIVIQAQWFSGLSPAVVASGQSTLEDDAEKVHPSVIYH